MKPHLKSLAAVFAVTLLIFGISCKDGKDNQSVNTLLDSGQAQQAAEDRADSAALVQYTVSDPKVKHKQLHDWKRNKQYTICVKIDFKGSDKYVNIEFTKGNSHSKVIGIPAQQSGTQTVVYVHMKAQFTPSVSVTFYDVNGTADYADVVDSRDSACNNAQTVTDKVQSTSSQSSTVLVTIDEQ